MRSRVHFSASLLISVPAITQSNFLLLAAIMCTGWLVDADHEFDYYVLTGRFAFNPFKLASELGAGLFSKNMRRSIVLFHGWEWLVLMSFLRADVMILVSYAVHLSLDVLGNNIYPQSMSVLWRLKNKWKVRIRGR